MYSSLNMASPVSLYPMDNPKIQQLHFTQKFKTETLHLKYNSLVTSSLVLCSDQNLCYRIKPIHQ